MALKTKSIIVLALLLVAFAQIRLSAQYTFQDYLYSPVHDIPIGACPAVGGGYIIGMSSYTMVKIAADGQLAWSKDIVFASQNYYYNSIVASADSAYLLSGYISTLNPNSGFDQSLIVTKTDTLGNVLWTSYIDSTNGTFANNILDTPDGGALVAYTELDIPSRNIMLARFSGSGVLLWHKRYAISSSKNVSYAISKSHDGGYVIASKYDLVGFVLKVDSLGNQVWTRTSSVPISTANNMTDIARAGSGYAFLMYTPDVYFLDASGNAIIDKQFVGVNGTLVFSNISETSDGGLLISGKWVDATFTNAPMLIKTDSSGNVQWSRVYRRNFCYPIEQFETADGGYFMVDEIVYNNTYKTYVVKTDSLGDSKCTDAPFTASVSSVLFNTNPATCVITNGRMPTTSLIGTTTPRPLSDSIKCQTLIGLNEPDHNNAYNIYPNPGDGNFTVKATKGVSIAVYDMQGKLVLSAIAQSELTAINLTSFAAGLYAVVIVDEKHYSSLKLIRN